jgi:hypothetical protein
LKFVAPLDFDERRPRLQGDLQPAYV